MQRLNPYHKAQRAFEVKAAAARQEARKAALKHKRSKSGRKEKAIRNKRFSAIESELQSAFAEADKADKAQEEAGRFNPDGANESD